MVFLSLGRKNCLFVFFLHIPVRERWQSSCQNCSKSSSELFLNSSISLFHPQQPGRRPQKWPSTLWQRRIREEHLAEAHLGRWNWGGLVGGRFFQSIQAAFQLEDGHLKICNDCKKGWGGRTLACRLSRQICSCSKWDLRSPGTPRLIKEITHRSRTLLGLVFCFHARRFSYLPLRRFWFSASRWEILERSSFWSLGPEDVVLALCNKENWDEADLFTYMYSHKTVKQKVKPLEKQNLRAHLRTRPFHLKALKAIYKLYGTKHETSWNFSWPWWAGDEGSLGSLNTHKVLNVSHWALPEGQLVVS